MGDAAKRRTGERVHRRISGEGWRLINRARPRARTVCAQGYRPPVTYLA
jgi:hypothetical protein